MARGRKSTTAAQEPIQEEVKEEVKEEIKEEPKKVEKPVKEDDEVAELKRQLAEMKELLKQATEAKQAHVIQMTQQESERVHFLFEAEVADDNIFIVGENGRYGRITGKTGSFYVPKNDLSSVMDGAFQSMMENRWIIVVSGLTDEEREAFGVDYKEGEYLDKKAFAKMVDLGDEMLEIYPKLCKGHKEMVAKRYYEAFRNGNPKVTRELVTKLNTLSKEAGSVRGDFINIIEEMNAADAQ